MEKMIKKAETQEYSFSHALYIGRWESKHVYEAFCFSLRLHRHQFSEFIWRLIKIVTLKSVLIKCCPRSENVDFCVCVCICLLFRIYHISLCVRIYIYIYLECECERVHTMLHTYLGRENKWQANTRELKLINILPFFIVKHFHIKCKH